METSTIIQKTDEKGKNVICLWYLWSLSQIPNLIRQEYINRKISKRNFVRALISFAYSLVKIIVHFRTSFHLKV